MINILSKRYLFLGISWMFFIFSIILIFIWKLNLWIDMTWGTQSEYSYKWEINIEEIRQWIEQKVNSFNKDKNIINWVSVYPISQEKKIVVVTWFSIDINEKTLEKYKNDFKENISDYLKSINNTFSLERYINIWKTFWDYIKNTAKITLIIALVSISIYIYFAFFWVISWINPITFAIVTLITLFHDVIITTWLYIFSWMFFLEFKIDTFFITALLTILGYSINDTIVIFDRIRYNLKLYWWKSKKLDEIIENSIEETLTRSIYTSLTLIFVLITIFVFWPESLRWFMLTLIFGTIVWTYSSIFVASPMFYELNKNKTLKVYKKTIKSDDDKIVV